jgi:hypothetical protein
MYISKDYNVIVKFCSGTIYIWQILYTDYHLVDDRKIPILEGRKKTKIIGQTNWC